MRIKMKIKPTETAIHTNRYGESEQLSEKQNKKIFHRMIWLRDNYLEKIMYANGETLYRSHRSALLGMDISL